MASLSLREYYTSDGAAPAVLSRCVVTVTAPVPAGEAIAGDEGDMSPQYSDRGDDMLYVPHPKKLTSQCMPLHASACQPASFHSIQLQK